MYIAIVGGGKVGVYLANFLLNDGHEVAIIEAKESVAKILSETMQGPFLVICGDGCEVSRQEDAGVDHADIFVAATGRDEDNLAACEIANRVFDVQRCIARVNNPKNLRIFRRLGIESISSTALIARMIQEEAMLGSMSVAVAMTNDDLALIDITVPGMQYHDNETGVRTLDIEFDEGIRMVAVNHGDEIEVVGNNTIIHPGDEVIVAADTDKLTRAREIIRAL